MFEGFETISNPFNSIVYKVLEIDCKDKTFTINNQKQVRKIQQKQEKVQRYFKRINE
jgi:hypothetical protein